MSDKAWKDIQDTKDKRKARRDRLAQIKQANQAIADEVISTGVKTAVQTSVHQDPLTEKPAKQLESHSSDKLVPAEAKLSQNDLLQLENDIIQELDSPEVQFPLDAITLSTKVAESSKLDNAIAHVNQILEKLESQTLCVTEKFGDSENSSLRVLSANKEKLDEVLRSRGLKRLAKPDADVPEDETPAKKEKKPLDISTLLSGKTAKEKQYTKMNEEIHELLTQSSIKEQMLASKFKSKSSAVKEYCSSGTRQECWSKTRRDCGKVHFRRLIHQHTETALGDCSFLDTCFHMDTCKYIHYEVDQDDINKVDRDMQAKALKNQQVAVTSDFKLMPPQWVQCDMRKFDMTVLGKFAVIMADPPWDIHMELPYGTMADDEMRNLNVPCLQDDGFIFLWVTGRAMELGRECLSLWGYRRCDELIWVKTNQLQKLIRTGRTGHWINHGKEHCLIGIKGNPQNVNFGLDCDVIVAQVRATSHKPDEVYGLIERLSPGTRKIELFGRPHNSQPNWITLGNQLDGVQIHEEDVKRSFMKRYPDGKCI